MAFEYVVALIGGTGDQGKGLAARWAKAGIEVIIGSRSRERALRAAEEVSELADRGVRGLLNHEAAEQAQVIVLTIPYEGLEKTMSLLRRDLEGKIVVSPIVPPRDAPRSAAETVRALAPKSTSVASAFHSIGAHALLDLEKPVECDVAVCGDEEAKKIVIELAENIPGVRALDGGSLENSGIIEGLTHLLIHLNKRYKRKAIGVRFTGI